MKLKTLYSFLCEKLFHFTKLKLKTLYSFLCEKLFHFTKLKLKTLYSSFCDFLCEKLFHFTKLKALCLLSVFLLVPVVLFFGCNVTPVPQVQNTNTNKDTKETTKKEKSTRSTTSARISCKDEGSGDCDKACKKLCDTMFSRNDDEKECQKYSDSLVEDMDDLLDDLERGKNTDSLDITALKCILDIDDGPVIDAIEDMSSGSAKQFLEDIAKDEELAETLSDDDEDLDILKAIFKEAAGGSTDLKRHLSIAIDDGKSFLWLVAEESNEPAWDWLEDYVGEECDDGDSDCPGGENIGAYCNALLEESDGDLNNFLNDADLFADEYENDVEGDDYVYEVTDSVSSDKNGDFEAWCQVQKQVNACPPNNPPAAEKLATLTFNNSHSGPMHRYYWIAGGYCYPGTPQVERATSLGSSSRSQNIILDLNDYQYLNRTPFGVLFLNDAEISYSSRKTYYLYLDNNRYPLEATKKQDDYTEECGTRTREVIWWSGIFTAKLTKNTYDVWIASEEDGDCTYYKP